MLKSLRALRVAMESGEAAGLRSAALSFQKLRVLSSQNLVLSPQKLLLATEI